VTSGGFRWFETSLFVTKEVFFIFDYSLIKTQTDEHCTH